MILIQKYQSKDKTVVQRICIGELAWGKDEYMRTVLLTSFCNFYIECDPGNCFVSVNKNDETIGISSTQAILKIGNQYSQANIQTKPTIPSPRQWINQFSEEILNHYANMILSYLLKQ